MTKVWADIFRDIEDVINDLRELPESPERDDSVEIDVSPTL